MVTQARRQAQAAAAVPIIGMSIIIGDRRPRGMAHGIHHHRRRRRHRHLAVVNLASLAAVARQRGPRVHRPRPRRRR